MENAKHAAGKRRLGRRIVTLVTVVAACVALTAGGTLAYFTASEKAHNVITSGGVGIQLNEWADLERTVPFEDVDGVMPGQSVVKVVEVKNDGQADAWVRVKAEVEMLLAGVPQGEEPEGALSAVSIDYDEENWTLRDGWWYYGEALPAGETTKPLFEHVSFDAAMGNVYQGCEVTVDVFAQAVQTANNGESALAAAGWPAE